MPFLSTKKMMVMVGLTLSRRIAPDLEPSLNYRLTRDGADPPGGAALELRMLPPSSRDLMVSGEQ